MNPFPILFSHLCLSPAMQRPVPSRCLLLSEPCVAFGIPASVLLASHMQALSQESVPLSVCLSLLLADRSVHTGVLFPVCTKETRLNSAHLSVVAAAQCPLVPWTHGALSTGCLLMPCGSLTLRHCDAALAEFSEVLNPCGTQ